MPDSGDYEKRVLECNAVSSGSGLHRVASQKVVISDCKLIVGSKSAMV
jgi:hypothetical protein